MGANSHTNYALRKNGLQQIDADPPRARGAARRHPRHHLRPDHLPGAGDGDRAEGRRLHARPGRHPAPRDGQEEEVRARQAVRGLLRRHEGQRVTRDAAVKTLWDILLPFSDYAFNKAHSAAYGVHRATGRRTSRRTTRPSTWPRCSRASATRRTSSRVYLNECRRMGIKVLAARRQRVDRLLRRRRRRHPLRPRRGAQRRLERRRRDRRGARGRRAASSRSTTSSRRCPIQVANKRTVESLIKAGAFDSLGVDPAGAHGDPRGRRRAGRAATSAREANGEVGFDFDSLWDEPTRHAATGAGPAGVDQEATSSRSSARCSACTSPTTRSPGSRCRSRSTPSTTHPRAAGVAMTAQDGERSPSPGSSPACSTASAASQRQPVRHDHRSRTSAARSP